jgi:hypothetical protein
MAPPRKGKGRKFVDHATTKMALKRERVKIRRYYLSQKNKGTRAQKALQAKDLALFKDGIPVWEAWLDAWNDPAKPQPMWVPQPFDSGVLAVLEHLTRLLMTGLMGPWTKSQYYLDEYEILIVGPIAITGELNGMDLLDKANVLCQYKSIGLRYAYCLMSDGLARLRRVVFPCSSPDELQAGPSKAP